MNRPLALIEGDLALPSSRPLAGLPPPFGSRRRSASGSEQRTPRSASPGVRSYAASPIRRGKKPPNAKFLFFYKLPPQPDFSTHFDEQLAEARHYLAADRPRPSSSRSDHVLGAAIFMGCSMALAWLLATCSTPDATNKLTTAAREPAAAAQSRAGAVHPASALVADAQRQQPATQAPQLMGAPHTIAQHAPAQANTSLEAAHRDEPRLSAHVPGHLAARTVLAKIDRPQGMARMTHTQVASRMALTRSFNSQTRASVSKQPEWTASVSSASESAERTALLAWATQQRRATVATRASVPARGDTDWNAHMTQRRITENPAAFQAGRAQP